MGREGGVALFEQRGPEYFRSISRGRKPIPRYRKGEKAGRPRGIGVRSQPAQPVADDYEGVL